MPRAEPPFPRLVRRPTAAFGWLDARLLREDWLARLGPEATAVMALLALAADQRGASFYGRERMATALGISRQTIDKALARLVALQLLAHRPWRPGHPDGVWQLLPLHLPTRSSRRTGDPVPVGELIVRVMEGR